MNARTNERTHDMTPQFQEIEIASRSPPGPSLGRLSETRGGSCRKCLWFVLCFFLFCLFFIFCFLLISVDFYWSSLIFIDVLWFPLIFLIFVDFFGFHVFSLIFAAFHLFSLIVRWLLLFVVFFGFRWSGGWVVGKWWEGGNGKGMKISSLAANVRRMNAVHFWFWAFLAPPFADFQCMPDTAFLLSMPLALCQSTPACPEGTQAFALRHKTRGIERTIFSGHRMLPVGTHVFLCAMCVCVFFLFYDFRWLFVDCLLIVIDVWLDLFLWKSIETWLKHNRKICRQFWPTAKDAKLGCRGERCQEG